MLEVKRALIQHLEKNIVPFINSTVFEPYDLQIQKVYSYEKGFVDEGMYPNIMLGNGKAGPKKWVGSGYLLEEQFSIPMMGSVIWDDSEESSNIIEAFAFYFDRLFEQTRFIELPIPGKDYRIHYGFNNDPPITGYEIFYEAAGDGQTFLRTFQAEWVGYITRTADYQSMPQIIQE